jgi:5-methylcytosine-specific restriction endonuclease McrA
MRLSTETVDLVEPKELIAALRSTLGWGPLNANAAVQARFRCEYCDDFLLASVVSYYSWEIDHITPGAGDIAENCALACRTCNHLKHAYRPLGNTRAERIADARRVVQERRDAKASELAELKETIKAHWPGMK